MSLLTAVSENRIQENICGAFKGSCLGSFHTPKTILRKVQKTLMLETDVPETLNEAILSVRKVGRIGIIAA